MSDTLQTFWWQQAHQAVRESTNTEPDWLTAYRGAHLERFEAVGLPDKKTELWKYTDIHRLEKVLQNDLANDWKLQLDDNDQVRCVVVVSDYGLEVHGSLPAGVHLRPVIEAPEPLWKPFVYDMTDEGRGSLPASQVQSRAYSPVMLNQAAFKTGFWLQVADGVTVKRPLQVVYTQHEETCLHINNIIELGANSNLTLRQCVQAEAAITVVTRQICGENACLNTGSRHRLSMYGALLTHTQSWLARNARQHSLVYNESGRLSRHQHDVLPTGAGTHHTAGIIHRGEGGSHLCSISQSLLAQHNSSAQVVMRALADDQAVSVVNCTGVVYPDCDDCVLEQSLKNLLLSDRARVYSKPALEIYSDEVTAAHGSTIGALDEQALFYLRSRGIPVDQARDILLESFLREAFTHGEETWRQQFWESLNTC